VGPGYQLPLAEQVRRGVGGGGGHEAGVGVAGGVAHDAEHVRGGTGRDNAHLRRQGLE